LSQQALAIREQQLTLPRIYAIARVLRMVRVVANCLALT
jgi:hypothetical protein